MIAAFAHLTTTCEGMEPQWSAFAGRKLHSEEHLAVSAEDMAGEMFIMLIMRCPNLGGGAYSLTPAHSLIGLGFQAYLCS